MSSSVSLLPGEVAERYVIEGEVGRGGTAIVYRARDKVRGMTVAIKVLREDATSGIDLQRFLFEIRQLATMSHPHIVPVLDSGELNGRPYFVLPFLDGGTLRAKLRKQKQLPFEEVITIGVTIARALEFAHSRGVIHRDVKPENILFSAGQACLADFGTARHVEHVPGDPSTSTGVVPGTAAYMSPEQASGEREYDGRTDIYSLGCVLYECVAGIQPFVGPTLQAIISQRLSHAPRPVSVFRPTVPAKLEHLLTKATAISPGDRYQRAAEFVAALEAIGPNSVPARLPLNRSRRLAARVAALVVATSALAIAGLRAGRSFSADLPPLDTTRIAILPFEVSGDPLPYSGEDMMFEGFRHWRGLTLNETYETRDALRQNTHGETDAQAGAAALSAKAAARLVRPLGAGRFVRGKIINTLGRPTIRAAIYDVESARPLYEASLDVSGMGDAVFEAFASLADSLVLRARSTAVAPVAHDEVSDLASAQIFLRARSALDDWNLADADSLFALAAASDTQNPRPAFWRAQVRSWRGVSPTRWGSLWRLSSDDSIALSSHERDLARGLVALQDKDYPAACAIYRQIVKRRPNDFAGWYGLGECHRLDRLVIPDAHSPSHWRFRTSYEQAIQAYRNALKLLPSSYLALNGNGYAQLQPQLFTDPLFFATGMSADSQLFWAWTEVRHDTAEFIPRPMAEMSTPSGRADTAAVARAVNRHRMFFFEIARSWTRALPSSVGAKEAFAISLEMIGDPSAADSFATARRVSHDHTQQIRLAVAEAIMRFKIGVSTDPGQMAVASRLSDSILGASSGESPQEFELLSRLAALSGRCALAGAYAIRAGNVSPLPRRPIPPTLLRSIDSAFVAAASGCEWTPLPDVAGALQAAGVSADEAITTEATLLGSVVGSRFPDEPRRVAKYVPLGTDYVLLAEDQLSRGKRDSARATLSGPLAFKRLNFAGMLTPDAAYTEAKLWLTIGDTSTAVWLLDNSLDGLRFMPPMRRALFVNTLRLGGVGLAANLRARLAGGAEGERWRSVVAELWKHADAPLQSQIRTPTRRTR